MSYSTLYVVYKTRINALDEFRNGYGSGPILWDYLCETYLGWNGGYIFGRDLEPLWKLARDPRVPIHFRIALTMTFDDAVITTSNLVQAGEACRKVGAILTTYSKGERVNHWEAFGDCLADYRTVDRRVRGVALNCTSVGDHWRDGFKTKDIFCAVSYAHQVEG